MRHYDLTDVTIVVVERNATMQKLIRQMLKSLKINKYRMFSSGRNAFENLAELQPDLLIVDSLSDDISGINLVRAVRNDDSPNPYLSIIMMSGLSSLETIIDARNAGVNEFVAKPMSPRTLYEKICYVIERPRQFIRTPDYFGPDRRRKQKNLHGRPDRRASADEGSTD